MFTYLYANHDAVVEQWLATLLVLLASAALHQHS